MQRIAYRPRRIPAVRLAAAAAGALAVGAIAIGALAIARLAIGRLAVGKARFGKVEIDDLTVRRLHVLGGISSARARAGAQTDGSDAKPRPRQV